jgi:hypothetical protein
MSTADWSQMDPSVPSIVTSSDLFDGELFGDELIDIYNSSSAEERCNPDDGNGALPTNEDSLLLLFIYPAPSPNTVRVLFPNISISECVQKYPPCCLRHPIWME